MFVPFVCSIELQLKGSGKTVFSRGFDGKAVLRSCIREYLGILLYHLYLVLPQHYVLHIYRRAASEAMHHLRVPTTRALSVRFFKRPYDYILICFDCFAIR